METDLVDVKEPIRAFILEYAAGRGLTELKDDDLILKTDVIDSLGSFRLIAFLEETFPLTIEDTDMDPDNFQTLNDVESFVFAKLGKVNGEAEQPVDASLAVRVENSPKVFLSTAFGDVRTIGNAGGSVHDRR